MEIAGIGLLSAFVAGVISFISPCVLLLVIVGVAMMTGQLTVFAYWLLRAFPVLSTIG